MRLLILAILSIGLLSQPLQARIGSQSGNPDFDGSGVVDFSDFLLFVGNFGARQGDERYEAQFDLDGDGEVAFGDFLIFVGQFGKEVPKAMGKIYWTDSGTGGDNPLWKMIKSSAPTSMAPTLKPSSPSKISIATSKGHCSGYSRGKNVLDRLPSQIVSGVPTSMVLT